MPNRRDFLKLGGSAALVLSGKFKLLRTLDQSTLPAVVDPLYTLPIADPAAVPQFARPLPVVAALGLRRDLTGGGAVTVAMKPGAQDLLGLGLQTPVWGYAFGGGPPTYPGATIVAMKGRALTVHWKNRLGFSHLLAVDETLHWAFSRHLTEDHACTIARDGVPAVAHLHGGRTASDFDGLPEQWFTQTGAHGQHYSSDIYTYENEQEAATLWYHDHALGITRQNVYAGLAGFYLLRDENEMFLINNNQIPSGNYEIEMAIQDRTFYPDGRLAYPDVAWTAPGGTTVAPSHQPEFFGQVILVNGQAWPFHNVEPRQYRFRLLNGSDSRFYNLFIDSGNSRQASGPNFWVIGNDTGLLNTPVSVSQLTIGPGERYDVVVDFSGTLDGVPGAWEGRQLRVRNHGRSPFPKGATVNPQLDGRIMAFNVGRTTSGGNLTPLTPLTNLRPQAPAIPASPATTGLPRRRLMLFEAMDHFGRLQPLLGTIDPAAGSDGSGNPLDGTSLWNDPVTEAPQLGSTEIWEIHNATVDAHPIHLHLVKFQIVDRQKVRATVIAKQNVDHDGNITDGGALRNVAYIGRGQGPAAYEAGFKDTAIMFPGEVTRIIATFDRPGRYVWHCHILSHEDHEMMRPYTVTQ